MSQKVAIVHDWLVTDGGAEKVLHSIIDLYPDADIYTLVDLLNERDRKAILGAKQVISSFLQKLLIVREHFRYFLPLFPKAIESFDLSRYDLIISSSWAVAKGVRTHKDQMHICYCHTPIRYAWDLYDEYTGHLPPFKKQLAQASLKYIRRWDIRTLDRVDRFIANSEFVRERIQKTYEREARVVYPPVDTSAFSLCTEKEDYYLTASRLVPYKKTRLIVEAFNEMPDKKLIVIGSGEEFDVISKIAGKNVLVMGYQEKDVLIEKMRKAKAFMYAAVEDFGIVPIEALSCGTPVIALDEGGTAETIQDGINGIHFSRQTKEEIIEAVKRFETCSFDAETISAAASDFSVSRFKTELNSLIGEMVDPTGKKAGSAIDA